MKITLLHPSRGRAQKAYETSRYWIENSAYPDIQHILSLDISDPCIKEYDSIYWGDTFIVRNENASVVDATNNAALWAKGEILIYLSDDFKCPQSWDSHIFNYININNVYEPLLLKVDDCLQAFDVPVLTIPIMTKALYDKLGYFWHPEYKSMFVDQDLYEVCKKNNWLVLAPGLKFPHEHCSIGKAERDETYIRSEKNWEQGKALFAKRKEAGFPI